MVVNFKIVFSLYFFVFCYRDVKALIFLWLVTADPNALDTRAIHGQCQDLSQEVHQADGQQTIRRIRDHYGYI